MTTCLTSRKSIQRNRKRRDFRGSVGVRELGMKREKYRRTWEALFVPVCKIAGRSIQSYKRTTEDVIGIRINNSTQRVGKAIYMGEGVDRNMEPSMETISGRAKPEPILQTTLMGIASKARRDKEYTISRLILQAVEL